jgi:hypothetical protein
MLFLDLKFLQQKLYSSKGGTRILYRTIYNRWIEEIKGFPKRSLSLSNSIHVSRYISLKKTIHINCERRE